MKFSLFAHMEKTGDAPSSELYEDFLSLCQMADEGGMHAIWTGEHHAMNFTVAPNPFISIADLARRTQNVRLGTGTVVAPFWHPIKLAGEAAMADIICDGRLEVGIARGAYSYEYERLQPGMDAMEAGRRMREIVPAMQKLWCGDYEHKGEFYNFPSSTCTPRPKTPPPVWIAARDINSHEFAIEHRCNVQVTPLWQGEAEVEDLIQKFRAACKTHRQPDAPSPKIMLLQHVFVTKNEQETEQAARALSRFYCYFGAWFQNKRAVSGGDIDPLSEKECSEMEMFSPENIRNNLIVGEAKHVISRLQKCRDLGFDEFSYWADSGMPIQQKRDSLSRFLEEVAPKV